MIDFTDQIAIVTGAGRDGVRLSSCPTGGQQPGSVKTNIWGAYRPTMVRARSVEVSWGFSNHPRLQPHRTLHA
jgi:hypothetical protein